MEIKIQNLKSKKNIFYTVKNNETLIDIAKKFQVPEEYILQHNSNNFYNGKVLFIPEINFKIHIVKPFETLQSVSNLYGVAVDKIIENNNLQTSFIFVGQKLFVWLA